MKCGNFMCDCHDVKYMNNCRGIIIEWELVKPNATTTKVEYSPIRGNIKNCETRKRYNLWDRFISACAVGWVKRKWKDMKDKYYGRK